MRVLLIEDDAMIARAMQHGLFQAGFTTDWVSDGVRGRTVASDGVHDVVILDLGLPQLDGMSVLRHLRSRQSDVPILVVTVRDAVADRIAGLIAGADDCLLKPFDLERPRRMVGDLISLTSPCQHTLTT